MARTLSFRPRSVTGLILASFGLVSLPLVVAVAFGVTYVDRLSEQSQRLVLQGIKVTRQSRRLESIITDMERTARQYSVLKDPQLAAGFAANHQAFQKTLNRLQSLHLDTVADWKLDDLRAQGQAMAKVIAQLPPDQAPLDTQLTQFDPLRQQARAISAEGNRFIDNEIGNLQTTSNEARAFLVLSTFALIPAVVILGLMLTVVISRPIRQIRNAIRELGRGEFEKPVAISAPTRELDAVGAHLDWMRRRLAAAESEKNQFLRQMSHELKTPLASVREGVELLYDGVLGELSERQTEVVGILQENSLELLFLIENLLNFAAWQQHRSQLRYSSFALNEVADEVLKRHRLSIGRKQLQVHRAYNPLDITADQEQLKLLFDNLITNAIKYSPQGGRLHLQIDCTDAEVTILICDDGPGIPQSEREHIFNPFYQSNIPARTHVQGSGIGLSVVREVAHAHAGEVSVMDSEATVGGCFHVTLPRVPESN